MCIDCRWLRTLDRALTYGDTFTVLLGGSTTSRQRSDSLGSLVFLAQRSTTSCTAQQRCFAWLVLKATRDEGLAANGRPARLPRIATASRALAQLARPAGCCWAEGVPALGGIASSSVWHLVGACCFWRYGKECRVDDRVESNQLPGSTLESRYISLMLLYAHYGCEAFWVACRFPSRRVVV